MIEKVFDDFLLCKPKQNTAISSMGTYRGLQKEKPVILQVEYAGDKVSKVEKGDVVLVEKFTGAEVEIDGDDFVLIRESNIVAKLNVKD